MRIRFAGLAIAISSCLAIPALAQAPAPTPAPAAAPADPPKPWSAGPIDFSGLVDTYYNWNDNHPASGLNGLYNFNSKANQFSLNMAKLSMSHTADPIGFQVDLGFGRAFDTIHQFEPAGTSPFVRNIEQAFVTLKPAKLKGFQVDFGKFVTSAGAEVIETHSNWNYSRSLLFAWAIPYYHFGLRTTQTVGSHFTGGFQLVNGWNNVEDNNSGKTIGLTGNFTGSKASWYNTYYTGPEKAGTNKGFRNLYDTNLVLTPNSKVNAYFNFDYGSDKNIGKGASKWYGFAAAVRGQVSDKSALVFRGEIFNDRDGFNTGVAQKVKEVTLTYEYKWVQGLLTRVEYRRDWSDQKFFEHGGVGLSKNQDTLTVGVVAFFGPK